MSIIITDLNMPTERESLNLTIKYNGTVLDTETGIQVAEAHELPAHGRLCDMDNFAFLVLNMLSTQEKAYPHEDSNALAWRLGAKAMANQIYRDVKAYPTIIPAEVGE